VIEQAGYARWPVNSPLISLAFPKASPEALAIIEYIQQSRGDSLGAHLNSSSSDFIFYQEATRYWIKASIGLPFYAKNGRPGPLPHGRYLYFDDADSASAAYAVLMSSLFYLCFQALSDCFHVNQSLVEWLPLPPDALRSCQLTELGRTLDAEVRRTAQRKRIFTKDGNEITYDEFQVGLAKGLIDKIDACLGGFYGLSPDQIKTVTQYDIKFRVGQENCEESEL
jgi:hypothetical protein